MPALSRGVSLTDSKKSVHPRHNARVSSPRVLGTNHVRQRAPWTLIFRLLSRGFESRVPHRSERERRKSQLEAYFLSHQIEEKLNVMLTEMAVVRPGQPMAWLASRMERGVISAPVAGTVPLVSPACGNALAEEIFGNWSYSQVLGGSAVSA